MTFCLWVLINNCIVLVCLERLFFSALTAEYYPAVRDRRLTEFLFSYLQYFLKQHVIYLCYDPGDIACLGPLFQ